MGEWLSCGCVVVLMWLEGGFTMVQSGLRWFDCGLGVVFFKSFPECILIFI